VCVEACKIFSFYCFKSLILVVPLFILDRDVYFCKNNCYESMETKTLGSTVMNTSNYGIVECGVFYLVFVSIDRNINAASSLLCFAHDSDQMSQVC
jgi:hypothetical protein